MFRKKASKEALIPVSYNTRIRLRIFRERNEGIVAFTSQLEHFLKGRWRPVIRYDNAHGFVHKDFYSIDGKQKRKEKIAVKNLKEAILIADKDLRDNYEQYIVKFERDEL